MTWTPSPMPSATPESSTPRIVLGVAGGIAAYKSVELLRLLREKGYHVAPILTPDATRFVGTVTFSALASEPARTSLYGDPRRRFLTPTSAKRVRDRRRPRDRAPHCPLRHGSGRRSLDRDAARDARPGAALSGDAHRDVGAALGARESRDPAPARGARARTRVGALAGGDEGTGRLPEPATIAELVERIVEGYHGALSGAPYSSARGAHERRSIRYA